MEDDTYLPWKILPSFQPERLEFLAQLFRDVRHDLVLLHEPSRGDSGWSFACRAYVRVCHAISQAAQGEQGDWLSVVEDDGLHYVFMVGSVPLRFYRGEPNRTASNRIPKNNAESAALQLALEFVQVEFSELTPRLVIEPDELGEVARVVLVWLDPAGAPHYPYPIPLDTMSKVIPIAPSDGGGPDLPPPTMGADLVEDEEEEKDD